MNVLCRPLVAACLCLLVLLAGLPASGQFLPPEILEAETITGEMKAKMADVVDPAMDNLIDGEPEDISKARTSLLQLLNYRDARPAFRNEFSALITRRMDPAVNHDDALVRMNAMIILSAMVDDGSKTLIDTGLEDDNSAVKRWAMKALGRRMFAWQLQGGKTSEISAAVKQVVAKLDQDPPPHPIVVEAGLTALLSTNSPEARAALIGQLNKRVEMHAADPKLSYSAERAAIVGFVSKSIDLVNDRDFQSIVGLNRAMYRYASLIITQAQAGGVSEEQRLNALSMLNESLQGLVRTTAALGKKSPDNQSQVGNWIKNGGWVDLKNLVEKEWATILKGDPFNLKDDQLAVGKAEE